MVNVPELLNLVPHQPTEGMDALVLAGGGSSRMGVDKAFLDLGGRPMVQVVMERLRPLFRKVLVVARDPERYGKLGIPCIADEKPGLGPLMGLYTGLIASGAPWCFAVGCDMPFLRQEVIQFMAGRATDCHIVMAYLQRRPQPLHAFYSAACIPAIPQLLKDGERSLFALGKLGQVRWVTLRELAPLDPELTSFADLDTPEELARAQEANLMAGETS